MATVRAMPNQTPRLPKNSSLVATVAAFALGIFGLTSAAHAVLPPYKYLAIKISSAWEAEPGIFKEAQWAHLRASHRAILAAARCS